MGRKLRTLDRAAAVHFIRTSGRGSDVWLDNHDAIVLHGLCFQTAPLNNMLKNFSLCPGCGRAFLTAGCLRATLRDVILRSPFIRLAREVRAVFDGPVILSMGPFFSDSAVVAIPDDVVRVVECGVFLKKIYLEELQIIAGGLDVCLLLQPPETLSSAVLTDRIYSLKHVNPAVNDHGHMNAAYGGAVMRQLYETIERLSLAA